MTGRPRLGIGRRLDADAVAAAARANPRLRRFVRTVSRHSRRGDERATALLEHLIRRVLDDVGDVYGGPAVTRLERILVLREHIAVILDSVLRGGDLPAEVHVSKLGDYFDHLSAEMRDLTSPRGGLLGDEPIRFSGDDPNVYAQSLIDEFEGTTVPGGRHVEPDLTEAFAELPDEQQAVLRKAAEADPAGLWRVVSSDTEPGQVRAQAELEAGLGLTDTELEDLRAALDTLGRARTRGFHDDPVRLAAALEKIEDPELRDIVVASNDVWIIHQLAIHNPAALLEAWDRFKGTGKGRTPGGFRANIYRWMTHWGRATQAEYTAAFWLGARGLLRERLLLKGPDDAPSVAGIDLIGIGTDGWVWLIDDKSHQERLVHDVDALTVNLADNLAADAKVFTDDIAKWRAEVPGFEPDQDILDAITRMEGAAADIDALPLVLSDVGRAPYIRQILIDHRLLLRVTSAVGVVVDVSAELAAFGMKVTPTGPRVPSPPRGGR